MSKKEYKHEGLLDKPELVALLSVYCNKEASISQMFTTYITIFLSSIFIVLGACVIGMTSELNIPIEALVVCSGGILAMLLSYGMQAMCMRTRKAFLEIIAKIVIIEEKLGLDNTEVYGSKHWENDSLVSKQHDANRMNTKTINDFINTYMYKGQLRNIQNIGYFIYGFSTIIISIEIARFLPMLLS